MAAVVWIFSCSTMTVLFCTSYISHIARHGLHVQGDHGPSVCTVRSTFSTPFKSSHQTRPSFSVDFIPLARALGHLTNNLWTHETEPQYICQVTLFEGNSALFAKCRLKRDLIPFSLSFRQYVRTVHLAPFPGKKSCTKIKSLLFAISHTSFSGLPLLKVHSSPSLGRAKRESVCVRPVARVLCILQLHLMARVEASSSLCRGFQYEGGIKYGTWTRSK